MDKRVVAFIVRDAKNRPFVKACYDFGEGLHDPYSLSEDEAAQASEIYQKSNGFDAETRDRGVVKLNPNTGAIYSEKDHNPLHTPAFITGSEPGLENVQKAIESLDIGCCSQDVMMPLFVSTGKLSVYYNKADIETISQEELIEIENMKLNLFDSLSDGKATLDYGDFEK